MGNSDNSFYAMMEDGVPQLAKRGVELIDGEHPL